MAGVVQEIDLVLGQQALRKLDTDLSKVSQQIGTGIASGATPAAVNFSKQLITTLQTRLKSESGVLAKQLAEGTLSPAQYATAAQGLGKSIMADLKKGLASGGKLDLFGGEGGLALRNQLGVVTTEIEKVPRAAQRAAPGINSMRSAMLGLATQAAGVSGPLGQVANSLLLFGGGGQIALAAAAAIGVATLAIEQLTKSARAGRKATEDLIAGLKDIGKSGFVQQMEKINQVQQDILATQKRIQDIEKDRAALAAQGSGGLLLSDEAYQRELKNLENLRTALRELRKESAAGSVDPSSLSAGAGHAVPGFRSEEANARIRERDDRAREEAQRKEKARIEEINQVLAKEAARQLQIAEDQRSVSAEAQHALAQLTSTTIDDLQIQIEEFESRVLEAFGHITPEAQKLIDIWKAQLAEAKVLEPINKELEAFDHQMEHADFSVVKVEKNWEKIGETIGRVGQGILDLGRGLGIVDDRTQKVLQGFIGIGNNLAKALKGDPGAILGVVGGAVSAIGGLFGHPNKDPDRFAQNQAWFEAASAGDANALEQLRIHSVVATAGRPGWGSQASANDAKAKYDAALKASAPGRAASAADAAAQAERDRLEGIRQGEEQQVSARSESERRAHIQTLLAGGGPQDLANTLQQLEQEFERLVAASPLGEDSPRARDAKQRADDAARDLERTIDDAKRAAGTDITPGFTVQRTLTESSAGAVVGNLITISAHTALLKPIHDLLAGGLGGVAGGQPLHIEVISILDGREVGRSVSEYQAGRVQNQQALAGNSSLPS